MSIVTTGVSGGGVQTVPFYGVSPPEGDLKREFLPGPLRPGGYPVLANGRSAFDIALQAFGYPLLELMAMDPKINSTINTIVAGIWADGVQFAPPERFRQGGMASKNRKADIKLANEIAESATRMVEGLETPVEATGRQLDRGSMIYGCKLAEVTYELDDSGYDKGRMMVRQISVKPQWNWAFAVDLKGRLVGIAAQQDWMAYSGEPAPAGAVTTANGYLLLPRAKFIVRSWMPEDDDPRGRTVMRPTYDSYYRKFQTLVRYDKYTDKFAAPTWVITAGDEQQPRTVKDASGATQAQDRRPEDDNLDAAKKLEGNSALSLPHGATAKAEYPSGDGRAFLDRLQYIDNQIVYAIAQTTRATEEAQYGSRADSQTAQDILGLVIRMGKHESRHAFRGDVLRPWVRMNWGEDASRRLVPSVSLGSTEHQDFSRNGRTMGVLFQTRVMKEESQDDVDTARSFLGLPFSKSPPVATQQPVAKPGATPAAGSAPKTNGQPTAPAPAGRTTQAG
jgi:hypothetical protein